MQNIKNQFFNMKSILTACITTIVCLLGFSQIVGAQELPKRAEFNVTGLLLNPKTLINIIVSTCSYLVCIKRAKIDFKLNSDISHTSIYSVKKAIFFEIIFGI